MTLLHPTHWCRHCKNHLQILNLVEVTCCPICFTVELEELKELGDEQ